MKWRTGRKLGRTIYLQRGEAPSDDDLFLGMMETPSLAEHVVILHNQELKRRANP